MIGLGLSVVQVAVRQLIGRTFNPLQLFAANEQGIWLDPSDFSTMFQDAAGTTPVTAVEQPVGLMLDKRLGLVLGPELMVNGDFSDGTTGWTVVSAPPLSVTSGVATLQASSVTGVAFQSIGASAGKVYQVSYTIITISGGTVDFRIGGTSGPVRTSAGTYTETIRTAGFTANAGIALTPGASGAVTFDNISVRELPGNHATQATATSRPILRQDAGGRYYLFFDGIDDSLVTGIITPGTDKVQVFAGVRKLSDAARGVVVELSSNTGTNAGSFVMDAPGTNPSLENYRWISSGSTFQAAFPATIYPAPITNVLTGLGDISGDSVILRVNGTQAAQNTADQGTGNYLSYPLYIGRRGGTTLPANIQLYQLTARFGPNLSEAQITQTETFFNSKTGAY